MDFSKDAKILSPEKEGGNDGLTKPSTASLRAAADLDEMTMFEMLFELFRNGYPDVVGSPESGFAIFEPKSGSLTVFENKDKFLSVVPYKSDGVLAVLKCAQGNGASFKVDGEEVICAIDDVSVRGATYGEAAVRALLSCNRKARADEAEKTAE